MVVMAPSLRTLDELWQWAVDYALDNVPARGAIQELLALAGGNIGHALELMTASPNAWSDSYAQRLGGWGLCCDVGRLSCMGSAGQHPIHAWFPEPSPFDRPPDLVISWRDVFVFVATGGRQLRLLEDV